MELSVAVDVYEAGLLRSYFSIPRRAQRALLRIEILHTHLQPRSRDNINNSSSSILSLAHEKSREGKQHAVSIPAAGKARGTRTAGSAPKEHAPPVRLKPPFPSKLGC